MRTRVQDFWIKKGAFDQPSWKPALVWYVRLRAACRSSIAASRGSGGACEICFGRLAICTCACAHPAPGQCPVAALTGLRVANITCICGWIEASRSAAATCTASSCRLRSSSHAADADGLSAPACAGPSSKMTLTPVPIRDLTAVACAMPRLSATTASLSTAACVSVASRHAEALLSRNSSSPPENNVLCHHLWPTQRDSRGRGVADAHDPASAWATMSRIGTRSRSQIDAAGSSGLLGGTSGAKLSPAWFV